MSSSNTTISLQTLNRSVTWKELEESLYVLFPHERDKLTYYKKIYWSLFNLNPHPTQQKVILFFDKKDLYHGFHHMPTFVNSVEYDEIYWLKVSNFLIDHRMFELYTKSDTLALLYVELTYGNKQFLTAFFRE